MALRMIFLVAATLIWFGPSPSNAVSVELDLIANYDTADEGLRDGQFFEVVGLLENFEDLSISSFSLSLRGFDEDGNGLLDDGLMLRSAGGATLLFVNSITENPETGVILFDGGIENELAQGELRGGPATGSQPAQELHMALIEGSTTTPTSGTGTFDPGPGGFLIQDGSPHFYIAFRAATAGLESDRTFSFAVDALALDANGDPISISSNSVEVILLAVPEPTAAFLLGLGLAGLAGLAGRSELSVRGFDTR